MCPGNERASGARNPDYRGVFVFPNDYPGLDEGDEMPETSELLVAEAARGECRVVCFSDRHDVHLGEMEDGAIEAVVNAWAEASDQMGGTGGARYVQVFENRGEMMGASNPHPHGQIWSTAHVPTLPARKTRRMELYRDRHERDLLGDYLEEELQLRVRIVDENDDWVQLVPFWAVWPFETMLVPRRGVGRLAELGAAERSSLAQLLGRLTRRYDGLFDTPFPYSMGWYQAPYDGRAHPSARLHASYAPPLLRSASIRKFLVGYELAAEPQRDFTAEQAAERLRQ